MVTEGDRRVKVQVGWIIQQLQMLDYIAGQEQPNMEVLRREIKFLLDGVTGQWETEQAEKSRPKDAYEELLKEYGW